MSLLKTSLIPFRANPQSCPYNYRDEKFWWSLSLVVRFDHWPHDLIFRSWFLVDLFVVVTAPGTAPGTWPPLTRHRSRSKDWTLLLSGGLDDMEVLRVLRQEPEGLQVEDGTRWRVFSQCREPRIHWMNRTFFSVFFGFNILWSSLIHLKVQKTKM